MTLQKYAVPVITPAQGGRPSVGQINGLPGFDPQYLGGFYPTPEYAALRTFIDGDGVTRLYPANYPDYRLTSDRLLQSPPIGAEEITQSIENYMRGQFSPTRPYAYFFANYNVWDPATVLPVVVPSPEIYLQYLRNEWGSGAITSQNFVDRGTFTFTADQGAYAVVGIAGPGADITDPSAVEFGFLLRSYLPVAVLERGVQQALSGTHYVTGTTFAVRYVDGVVDYLVNGVSRRQVTVVPSQGPTVFTGIACLYGANSSIVGVSVAGLSSAAARLPALRAVRNAGISSLPALRGAGGWLPFANATLPKITSDGGNNRNQARVRLLALRGTAGGKEPVRITLPRLVGAGGQRSQSSGTLRLVSKGSDYNYAAAAGSLPKPVVKGYAGRVVPLGGMVTMPRIRAVATGGTGQLGGGAGRLPALIGRAGRAISGANTRLLKTQAFGYQDPAGEAFVSGAPLNAGEVTPQLVVVVSIDSSGVVSSTAVVTLVLDGQIPGAMTVVDSVTATALLYALANSEILGASFTPLSEQGAETWVINAETGAATSYENYAFNSFGVVAGVAYGARPDGLYLLEGNTDAGQPIRASLSFGETDFGTKQLKRMESAYLGVSSTGTMYLRVKVRGGETYTYAARRSDDFMAQQRIDVGRGIRASMLTFEIYNSAGCDFELNTATFRAVELARRI